MRSLIFVIMCAFFGVNNTSFASESCESAFQISALRFNENRPLFSLNRPLDQELTYIRATLAVSRMKVLIRETKLAEFVELVETEGTIQIKTIGPGLSSIEVPLRDRSTNTVTQSEIMYAIDDFIIFSIPGDTNNSNRVFTFNGPQLTGELPLGEFLIQNVKDPWVALSRAMRTEEAVAWEARDAITLQSGGSYYGGYETKVYHFQLGLENGYRSQGRKFLKFSASKEGLLKLIREKSVWASVNQTNRGVHGLLFEVVISANRISDAKLMVESASLD